MSVIARRFAATPERTAIETWKAITGLVCGTDQQATNEFAKIEGLAASSIAEEVLNGYPLVITGKGPRLRVYCLYGDDSITGDRRNEDPLNWKPTDGAWSGYLPCASEDFPWISKAIKGKSSLFVAYDVSVGLPDEEKEQSESQTAKASEFVIDAEEFRKL